MSARAILLHVATASVVNAQVAVDRPVRFTSADSTQRRIDDLAAPVQDDALITLKTDRDGAVHWAAAAGTANAITIAMQPPLASYANGLLIRFLPVQNATGPVTLNVDGLGARKLLRPDLLPVALGQLIAGQAVEAQYADSVFILLARAESGCPPGYLPVNAHYCIQQNDNDNQTWFQAADFCAERGSRLCTWDEYIHACTLHESVMTGMFDDWEWYDDTADHTHTGVQGGRYQCNSQRSIGMVGEIHSSRCCYRLR